MGAEELKNILVDREKFFPDSRDTPDSREAFDHICRRIVTHYAERRDGHFGLMGREDLSPEAWIRLAAYQVVRRYLEVGAEAHFKLRCKKFDRGTRGPKGHSTPFHLGLQAIFAHASDDLFSAQARRRCAAYLWYAYRHYVPPALLESFVIFITQNDIEKKARKGLVEPGFREWVISNYRYDEAHDGLRGDYPAEIEDKVRQLRLRDKQRLITDEWEFGEEAGGPISDPEHMLGVVGQALAIATKNARRSLA